MKISVRLFALQRAQTGKRRHDLELPDGADVAGAWQQLITDLPILEASGSSVRFARNGVYVAASETLVDGDELAVIPPVAGGAGGASDPGGAGDPGGPGGPGDAGAGRLRQLEIVAEPLDPERLGTMWRDVATGADGAVAVFIGQTRETPGTPAPGQEAEARRFSGQRVMGLSYESFEPMALATLDQIADEIEERFGVGRLAIVHRVGDVDVGEASVMIVVAAPHREEAFSACRYAIEELKARAPIWKAERFADGSVWMGAPPRSGPVAPETE